MCNRVSNCCSRRGSWAVLVQLSPHLCKYCEGEAHLWEWHSELHSTAFSWAYKCHGGSCMQLGAKKSLKAVHHYSTVNYDAVSRMHQEAQCTWERWCELPGTDRDFKQLLSIDTLSLNVVPARPHLTLPFPGNRSSPFLGNFWGSVPSSCTPHMDIVLPSPHFPQCPQPFKVFREPSFPPALWVIIGH